MGPTWKQACKAVGPNEIFCGKLIVEQLSYRSQGPRSGGARGGGGARAPLLHFLKSC